MSRQARAGAATRRGRCEMSGFTPVPRWTTNPVPGVREHAVRIPDVLMAALRRLAKALKVPLSSVLLTGHAKVLGALSGAREVWTGYAAEGSPPLPCRLTIGPRSWREVLLETARAESDLLSHRHSENLRRELGLTEPLFETVFALDAGGGDLADQTVLRGLRGALRSRVAAALQDRRTGRGVRRPDRRLPPDGAGADRGRSRCRARATEPALRRGAAFPA